MSRRLRPRRWVLVLALMLVPAATAAAPSACPWHVADGRAPDLVHPRLSAKPASCASWALRSCTRA